MNSIINIFQDSFCAIKFGSHEPDVPYIIRIIAPYHLKLDQSHLSKASRPCRPSRSCPSTGAELPQGAHVQGAEGDFRGDYPWTTG